MSSLSEAPNQLLWKSYKYVRIPWVCSKPRTEQDRTEQNRALYNPGVKTVFRAKTVFRVKTSTMPRVVPDQRSKYENDELFRKLSRESEVE